MQIRKAEESSAAEMLLRLTRRRRRAKFIRYAASSFTLAEERSEAARKLTLTSTASQIPTELNGHETERR